MGSTFLNLVIASLIILGASAFRSARRLPQAEVPAFPLLKEGTVFRCIKAGADLHGFLLLSGTHYFFVTIF
jgi:hypothetical protein